MKYVQNETLNLLFSENVTRTKVSLKLKPQSY